MENERFGINNMTIMIVNGVATLEITDQLGRVFHSTLRELTTEEREMGVVA